jgi:hypothetical protein
MISGFTSAMIAAMSAPTPRMVLFIELALDAGLTPRYCTAGHDIVWNGATWAGMGSVLEVDPIRETSRVEAVGWTITFTGVPTDIVSMAAGEQVRGRRCTEWIGVYNDTTGALIDAPVLRREGRMSHMTLNYTTGGSGTGTVVLSVESRLIALMDAENSLWTHAEQQRLYPGDTSLEFVSVTAERVLAFGPKQ